MGADLWPLLEEGLARPVHWELSLLRQLSPQAECMAAQKQRPKREPFVLHWAVKEKRKNKKRVDCVSETGCPSCTGPFRQTEELKEHLHSLKIYLPRKKKKDLSSFPLMKTMKRRFQKLAQKVGSPLSSSGRENGGEILLCFGGAFMFIGVGLVRVYYSQHLARIEIL